MRDETKTVTKRSRISKGSKENEREDDDDDVEAFGRLSEDEDELEDVDEEESESDLQLDSVFSMCEALGNRKKRKKYYENVTTEEPVEAVDFIEKCLATTAGAAKQWTTCFPCFEVIMSAYLVNCGPHGAGLEEKVPPGSFCLTITTTQIMWRCLQCYMFPMKMYMCHCQF